MSESQTPEANEEATALTAQQYARSHPKGIGRGYWHIARNRILRRNLELALSRGGRVLDVGCGPGVVVEYLREHGIDCYGVDLGTPTPESPEVAPYLLLGKQAADLDSEFRTSVTTLLLMDVLEHLPEPLSMLDACYRGFPNAHTVYVTVPARMEVWSEWDEFHGHYRRYTKEGLDALVADSNYTLERSAYFFQSLYLAMRLVAALFKKRSTRVRSPRLQPVHYLLGRVFEAEHFSLLGRRKGSSLYAILRR